MAQPRDPYQVLGVSKNATPDEVKRAFRELAKKHHPDRNRGDKGAEAKFKEINAAYDILSDTAKRARFDRGEIDGAGTERAYARTTGNPFGDFAGGGGSSGPWGGMGGARGGQQRGDPFADFSADDIFSDLFGASRRTSQAGGAHGSQGSARQRGQDVSYEITIPFKEAVQGGKRRITMPHGRTVDLTIPAGAEDGQTLRLKGLGEAGRGGGMPGDALVTLKIEAHAYFTLKGSDVHLTLPVTVYEAALGAAINVPTIDGVVSLKIPPNSNTGAVLRLKGKGAPSKKGHGDQYVTLSVVLPESVDQEAMNWLERWQKQKPYDPRAKLGFPT